MNSFQVHSPQRIIFGEGKSELISQEIEKLDCKRPLIISDDNIIITEAFAKIVDILNDNGFEPSFLTEIEPDPDYQTALKLADKISDCDVLIGIGGGSVLDITKVVSVLKTNNQAISTMFGIEQIEKLGLKTILLPTTAGTGSEVTNIAILSDNEEELKKGMVSDYLLADTVILDPHLTYTCPKTVSASSGIDALIHAMEAFTSVKANPFSDNLAQAAIEIITKNILSACQNKKQERGKMLLGSMMAGQAFCCAGVTAVHAFAYPIGAKYHIPHGIANSIMLPYIFQHNYDADSQKFESIAKIIKKNCSIDPKAKHIKDIIKDLLSKLGIDKTLRDFGAKEGEIAELAENVLKVTRLLSNNPKKINYEDALRIYRAAY